MDPDVMDEDDGDPAQPTSQESQEPINNISDWPPSAGAVGSSTESESALRQIEHQFSCMATTDREVLIKQLQRMVGESILNEYAAGFFLDMNNWNLQLAVGSYFDLIGNSPVPTQPSNPSIIGSTPAFSSTTVLSLIELLLVPNKPLEHVLEVVNDGGTRWPPGSSLRFIQGDINLAVMSNLQSVDRVGLADGVEPSSTTPLHLTFLYRPTNSTIAPQPVTNTWQLCTPDGYLFGKLITFKFIICNDLAEDIERFRMTE